MSDASWLLLLYGLPTRQTAARVRLWRQLKKAGAVPLKTSAYILPDGPLHFEQFQWLAQQVRDGGGDASLVRVTQIENLSRSQITALFNSARDEDYGRLGRELAALERKKKAGPPFDSALDRLHQKFKSIREIDFFDASRRHAIELALRRLATNLKGPPARRPKLMRQQFQKKVWVTRPRPEVDRVGSAWLIQKFIDRSPRFIFATKPPLKTAIPYDMMDVEFSHQGDHCTFEVLAARFSLGDRAVQEIAEIIHDADLNDGKFHRPEGLALARIFQGWARMGWPDQRILTKGIEIFEALYHRAK